MSETEAEEAAIIAMICVTLAIRSAFARLQWVHDRLSRVPVRGDCSELCLSLNAMSCRNLKELAPMKKCTPAAIMFALCVALAACNPPAQNDAGAELAQPGVFKTAEVPFDHADWAGRWTGVEGMFLEIVPAGDGTYVLTMQSDLDTLGTYEGRDTADGIAFERGGKELLLKPASGDETGLKYLVGKNNCLMVASGEGYCRS